MILDLELGPGERLTERWAEAQLGASRTPVRAALLRLEAEGLVCREGRGWMVAPLDPREIEQLYVYREVLEAAAVRLAAQYADETAWDALDAQFARPGARMTKEDAHRIGMAFHVRLGELSRNEFIRRGIADAMTRLSRVRWLDTEADHPGWDEHAAILAALRDGNADEAEHRVRAHIGESRDRLMKILERDRRSLRARGAFVA
ncbi:GntR family transcriptional regulator [Burkholderia thailandensis]|uniref:FCD domain protein n=2 Tax=Burkholderia thailandensis TaxID=57975 RepID=A0AAW9CZX7_BURTH|nr:GntR family transcriptional regulator [Burkholderia thailandensis]AHI63153.1 bacterial regulatory s, gntR family protein [Burkholderia thailandensis H0587]AJY28757.1 bacterial regulatory s, gntR family protein [Burkholderia thailandensis 34]MCZ2893760.1 GntR family transcriptional regulator [Burkholderia thailandensis]MCZ2899552.1 GntR family transcriptional regulator [Burkholderia thailandensis]MDW9254598.1 FCD domain protein [Burkholderia thailandensis]